MKKIELGNKLTKNERDILFYRITIVVSKRLHHVLKTQKLQKKELAEAIGIPPARVTELLYPERYKKTITKTILEKITDKEIISMGEIVKESKATEKEMRYLDEKGYIISPKIRNAVKKLRDSGLREREIEEILLSALK